MRMVVRAYRVHRTLLPLLLVVLGFGLALPSAQLRHPDPWTGGAEGRPSLGIQPVFTSRAVVVVDVPSGQLLLGYNAYTRLPPGPLAHLLTMLTVAQHAHLDEAVLISRQAAGHPGVRLGLVRGLAVPAGALFQAFWYLGAADAGTALIEHTAGSEAAFRRQMSEKATEHGALETVIVSPLGVDAPGQWSTAYDLALLARAALHHPVLGPLIAGRRAQLQWDETERDLFHINSFLWQYPGATGVKSGYSEGAGYVLAASARRGTRHLVAVILGAEGPELRYEDAVAALDHAFRHHASLMERPQTDAVPYDVQPGDTLLGIAQHTGVDVGSIQAWNELADPNRLSAGTRLWLPVHPEEAPVRPAG